MTPLQIEEASRNKYNAIGDNFYGQDEIMGLITEACQELAESAINIETIYTTTTVASQQAYSVPTNAISIKRVEYDGGKLERITLREDDTLTNMKSDSTDAGTPIYYFEWNDQIYLRPTPVAAATMRIFTFDQHADISTSSTILIPNLFHRRLVNFVVKELCAKDQNWQAHDRYLALWQKTLTDAKKWTKRRKRGDEFQIVKNTDAHPTSILGNV
jgi:hypothetical protein